MLNGELCQICGEYLGEGEGFPQTCEGCQQDGEDDPDLLHGLEQSMQNALKASSK